MGSYAIYFLAFVVLCYLNLELVDGKNTRFAGGDDKLFFGGYGRHANIKHESGNKHVRPFKLEPFDSDDYQEDVERDERELLELLRRLYEEREFSERDLSPEEGLIFRW